MKIPKVLTICSVLCCIFSLSAQVFSCECGIAPTTEVLLGDGSGPFMPEQNIGSAVPGTVVWFKFRIQQDPVDACNHYDASGTVRLPNGTLLDFELDNLFGTTFPNPVPPGYDETFYFGPYTVDTADLGEWSLDCNGNPVPTPSNQLAGLACITATCEQDDGTLVPGQGGFARPVIVVLNEPAVCITKEACGYSKPGDSITYTYTIENCGEPILDPDTGAVLVPVPNAVIQSVIDEQVGGPITDLTGAALAACGPILIAGAPPCQFQWIYDVPSDDPREEIVNTVTINATNEDTGAALPPDDDSATVDLLHPDYTLDVTCDGIDAGIANFIVTFTNTGDVPLNIDSDCAGAFQLVSGQPVVLPVQIPVTGSGLCGTGGFAELACSAIGTIPPEYCELPNELPRSDADICEVAPCDPNFTVEKNCLTSPIDGGQCDLQPGDIAQYEIIITNTSVCDGDLDLVFNLNDDAAGIVDQLVGPISKGASSTINVEVTVPDCPVDQTVDVPMPNIAVVEGYCLDGTLVDTKEAEGICCYNCISGEGCTPGFWKNHPACWCDSYIPEMLASDVFTRLQSAPYDTLGDDESPLKGDFNNDTLMDALRYRGGSNLAGAVRNMLRHATSALLNGCSTDVYYPVSDAMVIDLVNAVLDSQDIAAIQELHSILAGFNEDYPCPINAHCERTDVPVDGI